MTYKTDPARWTHSLDEAPDVLRAPLAAARNEGPSDRQMAALALKLAALSAGTAAAASAATASAATSTTTTVGGGAAAAAAAASAGGLSIAKIIVSVALFGAAITGAVVVQNKVSQNQGAQSRSAVVERGVDVAAQPETQPSAEPQFAPASPAALGAAPAPSGVEAGREAAQVEALPSITSLANEDTEAAVGAEPSVTAPGKSVATRESAVRTSRGSRASTVQSRASSAQATSSTAQVSEKSSTNAAPRDVAASAAPGTSSEVELLRRARAALGSRPRAAFVLTQQHREQYPNGMFAQERDALAVEAMLRAGETSTARSLAERFLNNYPNSPAAHRFRETMGLR